MKFITKIIISIILIFFSAWVFFYSTEVLFAPGPLEISEDKACFKSNCFFVELSKTEAQREAGLMFRSRMDKNRGMLFIFGEEEIYPFWMRNTLIPLDIIWIDKDFEVVFIKTNAEPCGLSNCEIIIPDAKANYVLEINAGLSEELGIKTGDLVQVTPGL